MPGLRRTRGRRGPGESFADFHVRRLRELFWPPGIDPRLMLAERGHPLVRAEMRRRRRSRLAGSLAAAGCALAAWTAAAVTVRLTGDWSPGCAAARWAGAFVCFFPLAMVAVAALSAAGAVLAAFALLLWRHLVCKPLHEALTAFAWFDAVAGDEFRPPSPNEPLARWSIPPVRQ